MSFVAPASHRIRKAYSSILSLRLWLRLSWLLLFGSFLLHIALLPPPSCIFSCLCLTSMGNHLLLLFFALSCCFCKSCFFFLLRYVHCLCFSPLLLFLLLPSFLLFILLSQSLLGLLLLPLPLSRLFYVPLLFFFFLFSSPLVFIFLGLPLFLIFLLLLLSLLLFFPFLSVSSSSPCLGTL